MLSCNGLCCVSAQYELEGKRNHVFASHADYQHMKDAVQNVLPFVGEVPADEEVVLNFFAWNPGSLSQPEPTRQSLQSILNQGDFPRPIQQVVVAISGPAAIRTGSMQHFTFEPTEVGTAKLSCSVAFTP